MLFSILSSWIGWKERVAKLYIYHIFFILQIKDIAAQRFGNI